MLGYFRNPSRVQNILRTVYREAICELEKESQTLGCPIFPVPLFEVLDSKDSKDYCQKVEPSAQGGKKMAAAFLDAIQKGLGISNE